MPGVLNGSWALWFYNKYIIKYRNSPSSTINTITENYINTVNGNTISKESYYYNTPRKSIEQIAHNVGFTTHITVTLQKYTCNGEFFYIFMK